MFKPKTKISKESLLEEITPWEIFSKYLPMFKVNTPIKSPFRKDRHPSMTIYLNEDESLFYKDYGDDRYTGDCFKLVQQLFDLSFPEALNKIKNDFEIEGAPEVKMPVFEPRETIIEFVKREELRAIELNFWKEYGINEDDLKRERIHAVKEWSINGKKQKKGMFELCFAYEIVDENGVFQGIKIYYPERTEAKWFSSCKNNVIEGWEHIKHLDYLIISKSRKDRMVLSKLLDNVVNAQNESISILTDSNKELFRKFKNIWVFFDSDDPGVKACKRVTGEMAWRYLNTPKHLQEKGIKDPAEWVKQEGQEPLKEFIFNKILTPRKRK